jgi:hypothetical protein
MAKMPRFAKPFAGRWRIVEMDNWDSDFLDLVEEAHLTFEGKSDGEIAFGALKGFLDVRYGARDGSACAEFSWEGHDENDPACGRGWVIIGTAGRLVGHFYIHNGDDSGFVCEHGWVLQQPVRGAVLPLPWPVVGVCPPIAFVKHVWRHLYAAFNESIEAGGVKTAWLRHLRIPNEINGRDFEMLPRKPARAHSASVRYAAGFRPGHLLNGLAITK